MEKIRLIENERRDLRVANLKETRDIRRRLVAAQYGLKEPDLRSSSRSSVRSSKYGSKRNSMFKEDQPELTRTDYDAIDIELQNSNRKSEREEYEGEENYGEEYEGEEREQQQQENQYYEEEHDGSASPPVDNDGEEEEEGEEQPEDYE